MRVAVLTRQISKSFPVVVTQVYSGPTADYLRNVAAYDEKQYFTRLAKKTIFQACAATPEFFEAEWLLTILDKDVPTDISSAVVLRLDAMTMNPTPEMEQIELEIDDVG